MSSTDIDRYLAGIDEPKRTTLEQLRSNILAVLPGRHCARLEAELSGYERTSGSLHFPIDEPLPLPLVTKLLQTRLLELGRTA